MPIDTLLDARPLLASHRLFRSTDPAELADNLRAAYGSRVASFGPSERPMLAIANRVKLNGLTLHYCQYDAPVAINFVEMAGIRQLICLSGSGSVDVRGHTVMVDPENSVTVPPNSDFLSSYGESYSQLVVQFDSDLIRQKIELITGQEISASFNFDDFEALTGAGLLRFKSAALALAMQFSEPEHQHHFVIDQLADALANLFVFENRHRFSRHIVDSPKLTGVLDLRHIQDYIRGNLHKALTVESIAEAFGLSVRSVFAKFKTDSGATPAQYIREMRLEEVNRVLLDADGDVSVIDVALRHGFASLGHFSRRYQEKFGELPSVTAARRRRRGLPR